MSDFNTTISFDVFSVSLSFVDEGTFVIVKQYVDEQLESKQDTLIAGDNITIIGNVISATGSESSVSATGAPLYLSNEDSDVLGYKKIKSVPDTLETILTPITLTTTEQLIRTYLYDFAINTTSIQVGNWLASVVCKISNAAGTSKLRVEAFLRHIDGTETTLFSKEGSDINNLDYEPISAPYSSGSISCLATDRLGFRVYGVTSGANRTLTTKIGDGNLSYFSTPLSIRHDETRDKNGNPDFLHVTQSQKDVLLSVASGFENRVDSTISINETTGVFTLAPVTATFNVWTNSTGKHIITTAQTVTVTDDQTITYIYIDSSGILQKSTTPWNLTNGNNAPCAIVFKDGSHYTLTDERHGFARNRIWHEWAHFNIGTMYRSGLVGTFTNTTLSVTQGVIADEDIVFDTINTKTTTSLWYRNGASGMRMVRNVSTPYYTNGNTIHYDNGSGTLQPVTNNRYVCSWVYCSNDSTEPIYIVVGQNQYTTQALALSALSPIINLSTAEWKLLYKVIYQNKNGITTYIQTVDYRTVQTGVATTQVSPTSHSGLTERDAINSHPATAISTTPPSGYTSVDIDGLTKEVITKLNNNRTYKIEDTSVSTWSASTAYAGYGYQAQINITNLSEADSVNVVFSLLDAISGNYAPAIEQYSGYILVFSKVNNTITIPTIEINKIEL